MTSFAMSYNTNSPKFEKLYVFGIWLVAWVLIIFVMILIIDIFFIIGLILFCL